MAGWKVLVLVVALVAVACMAQNHSSYEEMVIQALQVFNHGQHGKPLFGLLQTFPEFSVNATNKHLFRFRAKETVCQSSQWRHPENCDFQDNGEERECWGTFLLLGTDIRFLMVHCVPDQRTQLEVPRVRRSAGTSEEVISNLPPAIRDMYEKAKYDILTNILRNF